MATNMNYITLKIAHYNCRLVHYFKTDVNSLGESNYVVCLKQKRDGDSNRRGEKLNLPKFYLRPLSSLEIEGNERGYDKQEKEIREKLSQ